MADSNESFSAKMPLPTPAEYPRSFGNYLLLHRIARGGMGEVFLAKHGGIAGIEKHCVVKTLRPHFTADREYVTRFIDEARIVVQLNHRNIAQIFDVGRVNKQFYLAMEFVAGCDLRSITERLHRMQKQLPENVIFHIVGEVLEALDYSHRHADPATGEPLNLVHRDISPQNVMVSFEGEIKLIDFGLAHSTMKVEKTQPNVVMGKMAYMAPEQARGDDLDGTADLFAAAVLLYEMLAGERYYEGLGFDQIWGLAGSGGHRPRKLDSFDEDLRAVLAKALAVDPKDRFPRGADFKEALVEVQYKRGLRPVGRELRETMAALFAEESAAHRDLIAKFQNVSSIGSGSQPSAPPAETEESQSFAVASVESFLDAAPLPDRRDPPTKNDVIPLRPDKTEVASVQLSQDTAEQTHADFANDLNRAPTALQSSTASGDAPLGSSEPGKAAEGGALLALNTSGGATFSEHTPATGSFPGSEGRSSTGAEPTMVTRPLRDHLNEETSDTAANLAAARLGPSQVSTPKLVAILGVITLVLAGIAIALLVVSSSDDGPTVAEGPSGTRRAAPADDLKENPSAAAARPDDDRADEAAGAGQAEEPKDTAEPTDGEDAPPGDEPGDDEGQDEAAAANEPDDATAARRAEATRGSDEPRTTSNRKRSRRSKRSQASRSRTSSKSSGKSSSKASTKTTAKTKTAAAPAKTEKAPSPKPKPEKKRLSAKALGAKIGNKLQAGLFLKKFQSECIAVGATCAKRFETGRLSRLNRENKAAWEKTMKEAVACAQKCKRNGR